MYLNHHKAARLKKSDRMHRVFHTDKQVNYVVRSDHTKSDFQKQINDYLKDKRTLEIWEGDTKVLIIYGG